MLLIAARLSTLLLGLLLVIAMPVGAQQLQTFEVSPLQITTAAGTTHEFQVELAVLPQQRAQGLMFRDSLANDAGMLFAYGSEARRGMWMANTFIPLDMLFIRGDGTIAFIAENTVPHSRATISPPMPVNAVLELAAGTSRRLGIAVGDQVDHPLIQR